MTRKMLKEEKVLREWYFGTDTRLFYKEVRNLVNAVREDDALAVQEEMSVDCGHPLTDPCRVCEALSDAAEAIRRKK